MVLMLAAMSPATLTRSWATPFRASCLALCVMATSWETALHLSEAFRRISCCSLSAATQLVAAAWACAWATWVRCIETSPAMAVMNSADLISSAALSWTTSFTLLMMISMCFTMRFAISSLALSRTAASAAAWLWPLTAPPLLTATLGAGISFVGAGP